MRTLSSSRIIRGLIAAARLGSGTPSSTRYLRGDQTWSGGTYTITFATTAIHNPADTNPYYFGQPGLAATTTADTRRIYIPRSGTIVSAHVNMNSVTAVGSNESVTIAIRLNNTSDTTIATLGAATAYRAFTNDNLSLAVVAGDYIEIKVTPPAWGTNPQGSIYHGHIIVAA